jgi:hypothetical protein
MANGGLRAKLALGRKSIVINQTYQLIIGDRQKYFQTFTVGTTRTEVSSGARFGSEFLAWKRQRMSGLNDLNYSECCIS